MHPKFTPSDVSRFWVKVDKTGPCWLWLASTRSYGYGQFWTKAYGRMVEAHRIAWELMRGPIPAGMFVCHNCPGGDNPRCVNPDHLFLDTQAGNNTDMVSKGRSSRGEHRHWARLTEPQVRQIRELRASGRTQPGLAREFGVSRAAIGLIVQRKRWKHVG